MKRAQHKISCLFIATIAISATLSNFNDISAIFDESGLTLNTIAVELMVTGITTKGVIYGL